MRHKITLALLGVVLASGPVFAQSPSPNPIVGSFHTISAYPPPQYFIATQIAGTDSGWFGYEVELKHSEPTYTNDPETTVMGIIISGTPTADNILCERQDDVQSGATVNGKKVDGGGTLAPPNDHTAIYACEDYAAPGTIPSPGGVSLGNCSTTAGIWAEVSAQGACYKYGEFCTNMVGTENVVVLPYAQGCGHYEVVHAFNNYGANDCCHTNLCAAGWGCLPPPYGSSCQRLCNPAGY